MKVSVTTRIDVRDLATILSFLQDEENLIMRSRSDIAHHSLVRFAEYIRIRVRAHAKTSTKVAIEYLKSQGFPIPTIVGIEDYKPEEKGDDSVREKSRSN